MRTSVLLAAGASLAATAVQAATVEYWWNITDAVANPDRMFERRVVGINGTWPPPPVEVTQGDIVKIHAYNGLNVPSSLHAHGMFFNGSNYMDGPVGVTQCGIPPGGTFDYEIDTSLQYGTYWIHAHNLGQYTDGLRLPFVIHPNAENNRTDVTWDHDYTIMVSEWYHDQHDVLIDQFMNIYNPTGAEPVPPSAIMYWSQNGAYATDAADIAKGIDVGDQMTIPFEAGKTYRLRFINAGAFAMFQLQLEGHEWQIIETDGVDIEPYTVDNFPISVAQRYSVLVTARNDTSSNYALHANFDPQMFDAVPDDLQLNYTATIQYSADAPTVNEETIQDYEFFDDMKMVPRLNFTQSPADIDVEQVFGFDTYDTGTNRAFFNEITYDAPIVPTIFTAMTMGENASDVAVYGQQTNAHVLKHMDMVQITINNTDAGQHPFHLHGHIFQIVHRSFDTTSDDPEINPPMIEGQTKVFSRDVVMVPPGGSTTIRFKADNPGVWFFHCHIDWHLSSGLASTFIVAPELMQSQQTLPSFMPEHCAALNIPSSGNAVGLFSTTDLSGQPIGPSPIKAGWTAKAKGAMAGCVLSALIGIISVVWYSWGALDDEEIEAEERRKHDQKMLDKANGKKKGVLGLAQKLTGRQ